jgi:type VI secretion system secreted protein Hcp
MAADFLLMIDGIKGESIQDKHKDEIEIESFSWGATQQGAHGGGGGGGAGKVSFQDLHFTSRVGKHSPLLVKACATGQHIKKALLTVRKSGGSQEEYYKVTLEDLLVSSYQSGGSEGSSALPVDQFSLNFSKIEFSYAQQKPDGKLDAPVIAKYSLKESK